MSDFSVDVLRGYLVKEVTGFDPEPIIALDELCQVLADVGWTMTKMPRTFKSDGSEPPSTVTALRCKKGQLIPFLLRDEEGWYWATAPEAPRTPGFRSGSWREINVGLGSEEFVEVIQ